MSNRNQRSERQQRADRHVKAISEWARKTKKTSPRVVRGITVKRINWPGQGKG